MSPQVLDPERCKRYRRSARPIVFAAVLFALAGIQGLIAPEGLGASTVARELGRVAQTAWLFLYAFGGVVVIAGARWPRRPRPELEVLGLWPLMGGSTINLGTLLLIHGPIPNGASLTTIGLLGLAIWTLHGRVLDLEDAALVERRVRRTPPPSSDRRLQPHRYPSDEGER